MGSSEQDLGGDAGERPDLARLLVEHGPAIMRRVGGKIPRRWQAVLSAEDVLQQTSTDAFLHFDGFVPQTKDSFAAWLGKIAERNLVSALRMLEAEKRGGKQQRVEPRSEEDSFFALHEQIEALQSTPSRHAARADTHAALAYAVRQLPDAYRRVVQMFDLDGKPIEEVAEALGRSPGAIYMIRARAHQWLGDLLGSATKYFSRG